MPGFDILNPNLDLRRNFFIEASAGTGKTFTIENAVVRLIEEGVSVEHILVVTFTRAATLELKIRIRRSLEAKKMKKELIAFDEAKIFTIHGFCYHTLKENAFDMGFNLVQKEESASIDTFKNILKDFLRTELSPEEIHPKQLQSLLNRYQNNPLNLLKTLKNPPTRVGRSFSETCTEIQHEIKRLDFSRDSLFQQLIQYAPMFARMCDRKKQLKPEVREGLFRFAALFEKIEKDRANCKTPDPRKIDWLDNLFELPILKMIPENLLKNKGTYPDTLHRLEPLITLLAEMNNHELIHSRLSARFQLFLNHVCEASDLFFYDDLLLAMQKCVNDVSLAQKIRAAYKIVLIDEFQDTDYIQWDIFSTLFLGHIPIYLVGDPKQSIYRFRGADLYTYMAAKASIGPESYVTLVRNFRSAPGLVHALNALFSRADGLMKLPKSGQSLIIPPIVTAFAESDEGKIIFCNFRDENTLFSFIVSEIMRLHQAENLPYSAFAVLVKDRYQAKRFCTNCPLPYIAKKNESLLESDALFILEDLLMAAYNPRMRQAVVKALGGPLFGISLEALPAVFKDKLELFHRFYHILRTEGILSFFKILSAEAHFPNIALYLDLLHLVEMIAENTRCPEEHLPYLEKLKEHDFESEQVRARSKGGMDAIQIMTTHVSKGLEFDVVFPIGLISSYDMTEGESLSENMRQLYVAMTRAKKRLYLPLAEKEDAPMHVFLNHVLKNEALETVIKDKPYFEILDCEKYRPELTQAPPCNTDNVSQKTEQQFLSKTWEKSTLTFPYSAIYSFSSLARISHTSLNNPHTPSADLGSQLPLGTETGIILHRLFEHLDFKKQGEDLRTFIAAQIKGTQLEPYLDSVEKMIIQTLYFPLQGRTGHFCLAEINIQKMKRELEFLYPSHQPQGYIKGFIDLFFEHAGYFYIIDWKSNFLENYEAETMKKAISMFDYGLQAEIYKTAAHNYLKLFKKEDKLAGIFYLFLRGLDIDQKKGVYVHM